MCPIFKLCVEPVKFSFTLEKTDNKGYNKSDVYNREVCGIVNRKKKAIVVLCACVMAAAIFGGCGDAESTPDEAATSTATVATSTAAKATETTVTEAATTKAQSVYVPEVTEKADKSENAEPQLATINVDGKAYTAYVGDTVNYVFNLTTPEALEDFQAATNYDSSMLELVSVDLDEMFPVAGSAVVCNTGMQNVIKYNAVNLKGMDFTKGGHLVSFKFKVLDSGSVAISTTLEYVDSVKGEPYVSDYKIVGDISYSEEII